MLILANAFFQNIVSRRGVAPLDGKVAMFIETESHIVAFKKKTPIGNVKDALDESANCKILRIRYCKNHVFSMR